MAGISLTVPSLVVRKNANRQLRVERTKRAQYIRSLSGVAHDRSTFFGSQLSRVADYVRDCTVEFAHVVKKRNALDTSLAPLVEISGNRKCQRVFRDPPDVSSGFRVVRVDRVEKCLEARCTEAFQRSTLAAFSVIERASNSTGEKRQVLQHVVT